MPRRKVVKGNSYELSNEDGERISSDNGFEGDAEFKIKTQSRSRSKSVEKPNENMVKRRKNSRNEEQDSTASGKNAVKMARKKVSATFTEDDDVVVMDVEGNITK